MKKILSLLLVFTILFCFASCKDDAPEELTDASTEEITTEPIISDVPSTLPAESTTADPAITETAPTTTEVAIPDATTVAPVTTTLPPVSDPTTTAAPTTEAPADTTAPAQDNSKEAILGMLSDAVNKTKAYTSSITVDHVEAFNIEEPVVKLDSAEMLGTLATRAVNFVKDLVLKPSSEVYKFSGGKATTSEGEQTQLLLPKDRAFSLPPEAVANAEMTDENGMKHIKITLVPEETHSLSEVPTNHANSIGYLDLAGSFKIIQIDQIDITYPGSVIEAYIREDGYVSSVTYTINLAASSKAHGMGVSGSATFSGSQTESWKINW